MSKSANHIIQKQIIEVTLPSSAKAYALQNRVRNIYYEKIVPLLDTVFSEQVQSNIIIRFNKVDLNLGHIPESELEKQLAEKIITAVRNELKAALQFEVKNSDNIQLLSPAQSNINTFLYFLALGHFPWWSKIEDLPALESEIITHYAIDKNLPHKLEQLINTNSNALSRLNFQFSKQFKYFLAEKVLVSGNDKEQLYSRLFLKQYKANYSDDNLNNPRKDSSGKESFDDETITNDKKNETPVDNDAEPGNINKIINGQDNEVNRQGDDINGQDHKVSGQDDKVSGQDNKVNGQDNKVNGQDNEVNGQENESNGQENESNRQGYKINRQGDKISGQDDNIKQSNKENDKLRSALINKDDLKDKKAITAKSFDKEDIYLNLSGLVLLHPFITKLFPAFRLTGKNNFFVDDDALQKAVHVLGYVATGETQMQEQVLLLPKLLCGMKFNTPLKKEIIITEAEKEEVTELLTTVVSYWDALKNTSPDGFRNTFLKRAGKLSPREGGWQLDVEHKTWDILLSKLPWGFSVIRLPWMKELLYVNWQ